MHSSKLVEPVAKPAPGGIIALLVSGVVAERFQGQSLDEAQEHQLNIVARVLLGFEWQRLSARQQLYQQKVQSKVRGETRQSPTQQLQNVDMLASAHVRFIGTTSVNKSKYLCAAPLLD